MKLRKMKFSKKVKILNMSPFYQKVMAKEPPIDMVLNKEGLTNTLSVYATKFLLENNDKGYKDELEKMLMISGGTISVFNITRRYVVSLLELVPDYVKEELLRMENYVIKSDLILEDEKYESFVREYICDEINLLRNFEFGEFIINQLTTEFFSKIDSDKIEKFEKSVKNSSKSFDEEIYDRVILETKNLKEFDMITLLALYNYKFNRISITSGYTYDYALRFKKNGIGLIRNLTKLKKVSSSIILKNNLGKNRRKGKGI